MKTKRKRTEAQIRSEVAYRAQRKGEKRLPGAYLSDEEAALLDEMAVTSGSKKNAILEGLKLLKAKHDRKGHKRHPVTEG